MPFTAADVFNAIVGYYMLVLAGSAAIGATRALRGDDPNATAAVSVNPDTEPSTTGGRHDGSPVLSGRAARITGLTHSRTLRALHRFGWATGVGVALGWLAGRDMYRWVQPRVAASVVRLREHRTGRTTPETPMLPEPSTDIAAPDPQQTTAAPIDTDLPDAPGSDSGDADLPDWLNKPRPAALPAALTTASTSTGALAGPEDPRRPGRPWLVLVPAPQEYPDTMPAAEITDLESLVHFTGETAQVAGMEAEDAASASASMIAGAEFAAETATRVADETVSLEAAVAAMAMLRVDPESTAAYHALLEAGQIYRDTTATFSAQCHDAAFTAGQMSAAAAHYHETAQTALAILNAHQMPHAEAAQATGHSGAHGAFYGVADTSGQNALTLASAPQLPAS